MRIDLVFRAAAVFFACCGVLSSVSAEPTKVWHEPQTGMAFVWVPKGCFLIGADKPGQAPVVPYRRRMPPQLDELPRHEVCLDGYWLGRHEVTRSQWGQVMDHAAPPAGGGDRHPGLSNRRHRRR